MTKMKYIAVVGSINADLVTRSPRLPEPGETLPAESFQTFSGGKGANQAVAIARLGQAVEFLGCIGRDVFAPMLRDSLARNAVSTDALEEVDDSSGIAVITTVSGGENHILLVPGANRHVTPQYVKRHRDVLEGASLIMTQLETPMETLEYLADFASELHIPVMLDPAPAAALPDGVAQKLAWLTPNHGEAKILTGSAAISEDDLLSSLLSTGASNVLLKLGGHGLLAATHNGGRFRIPAFPVTPVDTTAAGDALNGGLATALVQGLEIESALRRASAVAAISVTRQGAQPSMPSREEVDRFLKAALTNGELR